MSWNVRRIDGLPESLHNDVNANGRENGEAIASAIIDRQAHVFYLRADGTIVKFPALPTMKDDSASFWAADRQVRGIVSMQLDPSVGVSSRAHYVSLDVPWLVPPAPPTSSIDQQTAQEVRALRSELNNVRAELANVKARLRDAGQ